MKKDIDKHYVSNIDKFLEKLRQEVPESEAQLKERQKYERINKLRDTDTENSDDDGIWSGF